MRIATLALTCAAAGCSFDPTGAIRAGDGDGRGSDDAAADGEVAIDAPPPTIDAPPPPIDAPGFDPASCPNNYNLSIGGARYRVRGNTATYREHYEACADDLVGLTHLVVLSNAGEVALLRADPAVCGGSCDNFWTGLYSIDGANFQTATTEPVFAVWDVGQPGDVDQAPVGVTYNPVSLTMTDSTIDPGPTSVRAICECDGRGAETLPPF